ncbi:hypothetical protein BTUL_0052g00480 [Botrytis tulipae]|uniref:Uncharacterized protein n=1 Tax=Botrytis tulipae TaxID=87230 RepID=A0A4Z1ESX6_9HELO|nr:hypothetical protein BTUL_0052g00480 [Botrytis tulipae]
MSIMVFMSDFAILNDSIFKGVSRIPHDKIFQYVPSPPQEDYTTLGIPYLGIYKGKWPLNG